MSDNWPHITLLIIGIVGWIWAATPLLAYMVFLAEKDFRWPLIGWFAGITTCIFLLKFSLFRLSEWPAPGSWSSRFFYPLWLFASPLVPYLREILRSRSFFNRRRQEVTREE
jgi:hypothetical protein